MKVTWIAGAGFWANSYLYGDILVDAGVVPMQVAPYKDKIATIVLTHCHYDHTARLREIAHMCQANTAIHKNDVRGLVEDLYSLSMNFGARPPGIVPDIILNDGDCIGELKVLHTPGHTQGSICLLSEQDRILFSGDTVFTDGAFGRYDFPGSSREQLAKSLDRLSVLDIEGLYPGHGEPVDAGGGRHIAAANRLMRSGYG
jgi:glyoxylase-like metal-dependent hydrolase (beta-lactamase superfamily II)